MKKIKYGILALVLVAVFWGCGKISETRGNKKAGGEAGTQAETEAIYAVSTTSAVKGRIQNYLRLSGDIVASSSVDAYSDVAGKVSKLSVAIGSRVRKDDPIAEVDPSRPGMTYIPGVVKAPISGTVVSLPAQVGMTVSQSVPIARVSGGSGLEIKVYVAERFISQVTLRQPCEVTLDAYPGETFRGSVFELAPTVDPASRTMEVKVSVDNPGSRLKAGMFANVKVITEQKENIVKIPASAMLSRFGENFIFVVGPDSEDPSKQVARKKIITPGILIDQILEIPDGIAPDEEVIVRGQTLLDDGVRINVVERTTPLSAN